MKKLFTLVALLATVLGANAQGGKWEEVKKIDFSTFNEFPNYVMGYAPTCNGTAMIDAPTTQKLWRGNEDDYPGDDVCTETVTIKGTTFHIQETGENQWRQYFVATGIPTKVDGKYKVVAKVKASEAASFNVDMRWSWGESPKSTNAVIPEGSEFQEVEWQYEGIGGTACDLIAQPGGFAGTIEWQSLTVYEFQKEGQRQKEWLEAITFNGDAESAWPAWSLEKTDGVNINWRGNSTGEICAWGLTKGKNNDSGTFNGSELDGRARPYPADIVADPKDATNHVFVVHAEQNGLVVADDEDTNSYKWANQFWIQSPKGWKAGTTIKLKFRYMASVACSVATQIHKENPSDYLWWNAVGNLSFTNEWQEFEKDITFDESQAGGWSLAFNLNDDDTNGQQPIEFYFDDLSWKYLKLDDGYFASGINATKVNSYDDLDNAIQFEAEGDNLVAVVGEKGNADSYVDQIMISTVRGDDSAFKGATLKPTGKIHDDAEEWLEFNASTNAKLDLPGLGVWKIYLDLEYNAMAFEMLEGTAYEEPELVEIVTNPEEIVIEAVEREPTSSEEEGGTGATWDNQFFIYSTRDLKPGEVTIIEFEYKATKQANSSAAFQGIAFKDGNEGDKEERYLTGPFNLENETAFDTDWNTCKKELTIPAKTWDGKTVDVVTFLTFDLACIKEANTYTFKNIKWYVKDDENENGLTTGNLINATGFDSFKKKIGAGTDPVPTAISNIVNKVNTGCAVIYNLSGQRVSKDYKGIVITNGKKIVNK